MLIDTNHEIEEMQNELWVKKTPQERARFASAMFAAGRRSVIASLPKDLSEKDLKKNKFISALTASICRKVFSNRESLKIKCFSICRA